MTILIKCLEQTLSELQTLLILTNKVASNPFFLKFSLTPCPLSASLGKGLIETGKQILNKQQSNVSA
jgi:hypothetical protein